MYHRLLLFVLILPTIRGFSQDSLYAAKFNYDGKEFGGKMDDYIHKRANNFTHYLANYLARDEESFIFKISACETGIAMIKFKVKAGSGVTEVACTKTTNPAWAKLLKDAVKHSSRYWTPRGDSGLCYILPIYFNFHHSCDDRQIYEEDMRTNDVFDFDDGARFGDERCFVFRSLQASTGAKEQFITDPTTTDMGNIRDFVMTVILDKSHSLKKLPAYVSIKQDTTSRDRDKFYKALESANEVIRREIGLNKGSYYINHRKNVPREWRRKYGLVRDDKNTETYYLLCENKIVTAFVFKNGKMISYFNTVEEEGCKRKPWIL